MLLLHIYKSTNRRFIALAGVVDFDLVESQVVNTFRDSFLISKELKQFIFAYVNITKSLYLQCVILSILISLFMGTPTFAANNNPSTHTVQKGETLSSLSKKYNTRVENLQKWNNIQDINEIFLGQKISLSANATQKGNLEQKVNLEQKAKLALTDKNYSLAIKLLMQLYQEGSDSERQFSLEYLGVAREKMGLKAFAKQAYQTFIRDYPNADAASRVKLRLDNLIGIETMTKDRRLKKGKKTTGKTLNSYTQGSLAFDYRKSILTNDNGDSKGSLSLASTGLDAKGHYQQEKYNIGFHISAGHYEDLLSHSDNARDYIRYLSISASSADDLYQIKLGRQRSRGKGISGRFDGAILSSEIIPDIKVNISAGYPVMSSKDVSINNESDFYGLSVDVEDGWQDIDFSVFFIDQSIGDFTDRRAIGGEFSYYQNSTSLSGLVDYDIFFNEWNAALLSGSYTRASSQRYTWSLNYRKSPYISTRNALIGQRVDSLTELQYLLIDDEDIFDLARDRTLTSKNASINIFQPLNEQYDLTTDLTWMELSGSPESGGVSAISESGAQFYANIFLGAKKLYSFNDTNRLGLRLSKLATSDIYSIYASSNYRYDSSFSIAAKFRFDSRHDDNGSRQQSQSPTFSLQYQASPHYFYTDLGAVFYNSESDLWPSQKNKLYHLSLGYRWYF